MKRTLLAASLAALAIAMPGVANATPQQDQALFDLMVDAGIALYPSAVEHAAHVCNDVWTGIPPEAVVAEFVGVNPTWSREQVELFVVYSIGIYCPPPGVAAPAADPRTTLA